MGGSASALLSSRSCWYRSWIEENDFGLVSLAKVDSKKPRSRKVRKGRWVGRPLCGRTTVPFAADFPALFKRARSILLPLDFLVGKHVASSGCPVSVHHISWRSCISSASWALPRTGLCWGCSWKSPKIYHGVLPVSANSSKAMWKSSSSF